MISIALLLFIVLDPFGNLVTLNTLLRTAQPARRRRIIIRESVIALGILQLSVFAGGIVLRALGLQAYTLGISGGIVLFMIALGMIFPAHRVIDKEGLDDPLVVPIAMPLIAGPGAISAVILMAQNNPVHQRRPGGGDGVAAHRDHPRGVDVDLQFPRPARRGRGRAADGHPAGDAVGADGARRHGAY